MWLLIALCTAAEVERVLKHDRYLHAHYRFYTREMRVVAYTQLLESYRSVTLASMARSFAVSESFIDKCVVNS